MKRSLTTIGLLTVLTVCLCPSLRAQGRSVYLFGVTTNFSDSVAYVTPVQRLDSVVLAMGYKSNNTLEEKLKDLAPQVIVIGEARQAPGNSMEATGDALNAALAI